MLDRSERRAVEGDLPLRITAVPHRLLVPRVAQRVDVGRRHAVVEDAVVVAGESTRAARDDAHEVLRRERVADAGLLGKRTAERHGAPASHQPRGRGALGRGDEIDRADLVVLPPTPPVPAITDVRAHFRFRGQSSLRHDFLRTARASGSSRFSDVPSECDRGVYLADAPDTITRAMATTSART